MVIIENLVLWHFHVSSIVVCYLYNIYLQLKKGWAGDEMEYTVRKDNDDDVDMSSSSDDESVMEEDAEGTSGPKKKTRHIKMAKCVDTT
jgi:hypothetical protein